MGRIGIRLYQQSSPTRAFEKVGIAVGDPVVSAYLRIDAMRPPLEELG
jgi:hypothetical protein